MIKDICYATDDNYVHLAAVSIISLIRSNENIKDNITFHIVCINVSKDNKTRLRALEQMLKINMIIYSVKDDELIDRKKDNSRWPITAYARLFLNEILDSKISKVLYLDCDTVIIDDIYPLLNFEIGEKNYIAGVEDTIGDILRNDIDLPNEYKYINSGVMCIDLDKWRLEDITTKLMKTYEALDTEPKHCDQDLINMCCKDSINALIPCKYNAMNMECFFLNYLLSKGVSIVHYFGSEYQTRRKDLMKLIFEYYNISPWKNIKMPDKLKLTLKVRKRVRGWLVVNCRPFHDFLLSIWKWRHNKQLLKKEKTAI